MKKDEAVPMVDLASFDAQTPCNEGAEVELMHPVSNEPLGVYFKVLGKYSDVFIKHTRKSANESIRKAQNLKNRGKNEEVPTIEKFEEKSTELLVACTIGWRTGDDPTVMLDGVALTLSPDAAEAVYTSKKVPWIRQQIDEAIGDLGNFMTT